MWWRVGHMDMEVTSTKVPNVICLRRTMAKNKRDNQTTFTQAVQWIPFYKNPPKAVISPTSDLGWVFFFVRCSPATGGKALDQDEDFPRNLGRVTIHFCTWRLLWFICWGRSRSPFFRVINVKFNIFCTCKGYCIFFSKWIIFSTFILHVFVRYYSYSSHVSCHT